MASITTLDPRFRPAARRLLEVAAANGIHLVVTSARRSRAKQQQLYDRYLRGQSEFPALPPGSSLHEVGLAVDVHTAVTDDLHRLGTWWRSHGGTWGGDADPIHFGAPRSWWPAR